MKFVLAAVVVLAVTMGVQSSIIAGYPGLGLGINGLGLGVNGLGVHGLGINGLGINGLGVHGLGLGLGVPGIGLGLGVRGLVGPGLWAPSHLPAAVDIGSGHHGGIAVAQQASLAGPLVPHGATYVAKTRGAIHTAPLAGHINSAASINVAPAPGTW